MKNCPNCGSELPDSFAACPFCGASVVDPPAPPKEKPSNTGKIIAGVVIIALIAGYSIFKSITKTRPLMLNSGVTIEMYVGDEKSVSIYAEGLTDADYQTAAWSVDDSDVLSVDNGTIKASYDSSSFVEISGEGNEADMNPCSCITYVNASIKKGLRNWEGNTKVIVSLKPVEVESGTTIKEPADATGSSMTVKASKGSNAYFYLKSNTKAENDMSFIVKKGEETTVKVPRDQYTVYWATGGTWYGGEYLFGPKTTYQKDPEEWDFDKYTWSFEMGAENGNVSGETVSQDEFPES